LLEYAVLLRAVVTSHSQEETRVVREHRLNVVVRQTQQVLWVEERVPAAVQTHLTVDLCVSFMPPPSHPHSISVHRGLAVSFVCVSLYCVAVFCVVCFLWVSLLLQRFFLQYFDTVG